MSVPQSTAAPNSGARRVDASDGCATRPGHEAWPIPQQSSSTWSSTRHLGNGTFQSNSPWGPTERTYIVAQVDNSSELQMLPVMWESHSPWNVPGDNGGDTSNTYLFTFEPGWEGPPHPFSPEGAEFQRKYAEENWGPEAAKPTSMIFLKIAAMHTDVWLKYQRWKSTRTTCDETVLTNGRPS